MNQWADAYQERTECLGTLRQPKLFELVIGSYRPFAVCCVKFNVSLYVNFKQSQHC